YKKTAPERGSRGVNQFLLCRGHTDFIDRSGTAHFATDNQIGFAIRAVSCGYKGQTFRPQVSGIHAVARNLGKITVIDVLHILRGKWVGDVIHHDAAHAFQTNKGVGVAMNGGNGDAFRLNAFIVRAVFAAVFFVVAFEVIAKTLSGDALKGTAGIKHLPAGAGIPDRERARTVGVHLVDGLGFVRAIGAAVAVHDAGGVVRRFQAAQIAVTVQTG